MFIPTHSRGPPCFDWSPLINVLCSAHFLLGFLILGKLRELTLKEWNLKFPKCVMLPISSIQRSGMNCPQSGPHTSGSRANCQSLWRNHWRESAYLLKTLMKQTFNHLHVRQSPASMIGPSGILSLALANFTFWWNRISIMQQEGQYFLCSKPLMISKSGSENYFRDSGM
jgi:hypothetical protein